MRADEARALEEIVARYRALAAQCDGVLVVGTDFAGDRRRELAFNARVALNLGLPALLVVSGHERTPEEVATAISVALTTWRRWGPDVVGVVANRVRGFELDAVAAPTATCRSTRCPEVDLLMAPTVGQVAAACHGEVIAGDAELLGREALHLTVAAMTLPNLMERITDGAVLITPGDRAEVLLAAMFAHASTELPSPAGVVLTGGLRPPELILGRARELRRRSSPVVLTEHDTYETVVARERARGRDHARRAAQDHQGAGAVRDPRRRRRPARPDRRRALGGGHAADVRVHAARPRARGARGTSCCPRGPTSACCGRPTSCCAGAWSS